MKAVIEINMNSEAFREDPRQELVWILDSLSYDIAKGCGGHELADARCVPVGFFHYMASYSEPVEPHTPGPWEVDSPYNPEEWTVRTASGRSICDIIGTMPVDLANANLIAAAPQLLAVLIRWRDAFNAERSAQADIRSAEERAKLDPGFKPPFAQLHDRVTTATIELYAAREEAQLVITKAGQRPIPDAVKALPEIRAAIDSATLHADPLRPIPPPDAKDAPPRLDATAALIDACKAGELDKAHRQLSKLLDDDDAGNDDIRDAAIDLCAWLEEHRDKQKHAIAKATGGAA